LALLRKKTCNLRHPTHLRHPVRMDAFYIHIHIWQIYDSHICVLMCLTCIFTCIWMYSISTFIYGRYMAAIYVYARILYPYFSHSYIHTHMHKYIYTHTQLLCRLDVLDMLLTKGLKPDIITFNTILNALANCAHQKALRNPYVCLSYFWIRYFFILLFIDYVYLYTRLNHV